MQDLFRSFLNHQGVRSAHDRQAQTLSFYPVQDPQNSARMTRLGHLLDRKPQDNMAPRLWQDTQNIAVTQKALYTATQHAVRHDLETYVEALAGYAANTADPASLASYSAGLLTQKGQDWHVFYGHTHQEMTPSKTQWRIVQPDASQHVFALEITSLQGSGAAKPYLIPLDDTYIARVTPGLWKDILMRGQRSQERCRQQKQLNQTTIRHTLNVLRCVPHGGSVSFSLLSADAWRTLQQQDPLHTFLVVTAQDEVCAQVCLDARRYKTHDAWLQEGLSSFLQKKGCGAVTDHLCHSSQRKIVLKDDLRLIFPLSVAHRDGLSRPGGQSAQEALSWHEDALRGPVCPVTAYSQPLVMHDQAPAENDDIRPIEDFAVYCPEIFLPLIRQAKHQDTWESLCLRDKESEEQSAATQTHEAKMYGYQHEYAFANALEPLAAQMKFVKQRQNILFQACDWAIGRG